MSYESPITIAYEAASSHLNIEIENGVYKAVIKAGIDVNKDELIRALQYDRNQYEKGYADGQKEAAVHARWIVNRDYGDCRCSACGTVYEDNGYTIPDYWNYCPHCGAQMDK